MKVLALTRSSSWGEMRPAVKLCWRRRRPLGFLTGSQRTLAGHLDTLRLQLLLALPRDIFSTEPLVSFFHLVHVAIQCDAGYLCLHINNSTKYLRVREILKTAKIFAAVERRRGTHQQERQKQLELES